MLRLGVDACDEFAVSGAGRGEFFVSFVEFEFQVDDLLLERGDALGELVAVVRGAESGLAPGLIAEGLGEATLELLVVGGEARGAFVGGEQVGVQGGHAGCRAEGVVVRRLCLRGVELCEQVGMAVEEGPVDALLTELKRTSPHVNG